MATPALCPIIVVSPLQVLASDGVSPPPSPVLPPLYISGLVMSGTPTALQPISDPAGVDPTQYQVAVYAWSNEQWGPVQGTSPLSVCGTWSTTTNSGSQYLAVLMPANATPPTNIDLSDYPTYTYDQLWPYATTPNLATILLMPNDVFPQFLGPATAAFQACAAFLGYSGYIEQQLIAVLNPSLIQRLQNCASSIAAQYQLDPDAVNAVIAQLQQWVTNEADINTYFQNMWDFLVDEFLPQSSIITSVANAMSSDLVATQHFNWWSFASNLVNLVVNLTLNIVAPGLGSLSQDASSIWKGLSNSETKSVINFVVAAIEFSVNTALQNIPEGYAYDSNGLMEITIAQLEAEVSQNWQASINQLQTNQIQVSSNWRCLQWMSGIVWNLSASQAAVNMFEQNFTVMVWSSLIPLQWYVAITGDWTNNQWANNEQCLSNMEADPTCVFNQAFLPGFNWGTGNGSAPQRFVFNICEIQSGVAINPQSCAMLWGTLSPGIGLQPPAPAAVPWSYNRFEILTGPAAGQTSSNWSLTSGLSVKWEVIHNTFLPSAMVQLLVAADGSVAPPAASATQSTVTAGAMIGFTFSGFVGYPDQYEGEAETWQVEFISLVPHGQGPPSAPWSDGWSLVNYQSVGGWGAFTSDGLLPGQYDILYVLVVIDNTGVGTNYISFSTPLQSPAVTLNG